MKYRPEYPENPFEKISGARAWADQFVNWYNKVHLHSGIKFITPEDRHNRRDVKILKNRHQVYQEERLQYPERWSGKTRNWNPPTEVILKKFKKTERPQEGIKKAA